MYIYIDTAYIPNSAVFVLSTHFLGKYSTKSMWQEYIDNFCQNIYPN